MISLEITNDLAVRVLRELADGYGFSGNTARANVLTEIANELEEKNGRAEDS